LVNGWTRHIVRQGLAGILPEAVRLRGTKTENSAAVTKALQTRDAECLAQIVNANQADDLASYVDLPALREAYRRYRNSGNRQDEMLVWQATTLALWLRREDLAYPCRDADDRDNRQMEDAHVIENQPDWTAA
jgi:hypothetical protein